MTIRHSAGAALLALAFTLPSTPVHAQSATVPANRTTEIGFAWAVDVRTCGNLARPRVRIRQPEHGTVSTSWERRTFSGGRGRGAKCNGRPGYGTAIRYTPNRGYRGPDGFGVSLTNRLDGRTRTQSDRFRFRVQ